MQYMNGLGFKSEIDPRYGTIKYLSDIIIVEDLHQGNIWETPDGHVVIIDGVFLLNTPGQGFGGTFHFGQ